MRGKLLTPQKENVFTYRHRKAFGVRSKLTNFHCEFGLFVPNMHSSDGKKVLFGFNTNDSSSLDHPVQAGDYSRGRFVLRTRRYMHSLKFASQLKVEVLFCIEVSLTLKILLKYGIKRVEDKH